MRHAERLKRIERYEARKAWREQQKAARRSRVAAHNLAYLLRKTPWHVRARVRLATWIATFVGMVLRVTRRTHQA